MLNNHSCVEPGDEARKEHKTQAVFDVCIYIGRVYIVDIHVQPKHLAGRHAHTTYSMDTYTL